ncbi:MULTISPECIES: hypothetical protein [unclassified Streptomyces]|uniref:hypothetical protein n=1 Tax=unclassified Streptomyces TaxID=2593676 RepID=UPI0004CB1A2F|nr:MULTISPECIES: hypothetical protein [unclassified Streptomyces]KOV94618.1 hypothetical protein ADL02_09720 [Streptomyces sp. NRRL WC-3723]
MSALFHVPPQHAAAVERAEAALAARFPRHVPEVQDGWLILTRSDRPIAVWDLKEKIAADTPEQKAKRIELAQALAAAGLAVTLPSDAYMVFFAEIPADRTSPRYTIAHDDSALGDLFGGPHLVMDTWTNVHVATARTPQEAAQRRDAFNRAQDTLDAQVASGSLPAGSHASPDTTA